MCLGAKIMIDKILTTHPILGDITFNDLINDLEIMLDDTKQFEDIVYKMFEDSMDKEDLTTLFNFSVINRLEWIIFVLKSQL